MRTEYDYNICMAEKNYGIRIPPALLEELRLLAKEDARSLNSEMVWILRAYVEQRKRGKETTEHNPQETQSA